MAIYIDGGIVKKWREGVCPVCHGHMKCSLEYDEKMTFCNEVYICNKCKAEIVSDSNDIGWGKYYRRQE